MKAGCYIAADSLDRIIRPRAFDLRPLSGLQGAKAKIFLPGRTLDTCDPRDTLLLFIQAGIAGYERTEIQRRCKAGREAKKRAGCWTTRQDLLPMGTTYDKTARRWGYNDKAPLVKEAFKMAQEGVGFPKIGRMLGTSTKGAADVVSNPIHRGILADGWGTGKTNFEVRVYGGEGQEPQLVPDDVWYAVQARINRSVDKYRKVREVTKDDGWLSALMVAETMKTGFFTFSDERPHTVYYHHVLKRYFCRCKYGVAAKGTDQWAPLERCDLSTLNAVEVNKAVGTYLEAMTTDGWALEAMRAAVAAETGDTEAEKARIDRELRKLDQTERKLIDLYLGFDATMTKDEYTRRLEKIRSLKQGLEADLRVAEGADRATVRDIDMQVKEWQFRASWTPTEKRAWIKRYVRHISISNDGVEGVVLRVPGGGERMPVYGCDGRKTWAELDAKIRVYKKRTGKPVVAPNGRTLPKTGRSKPTVAPPAR